MTLLLRLATALVLLAAGLATAVAAVAVHELWWGLPVVALLALAALAALGSGWSTRLPAAVGFAGGVAWAVPERPEGDYAIATSVRGYGLLLVALLVLLAALATLPRPHRGGLHDRPGSPT
ncbi:hypothetical protein [Nocardioides sp.]|uniref:hypothetical protein n=1 Tax=Nocardioides sp. TaxID=35761 RepID=UPI002ED35784